MDKSSGDGGDTRNVIDRYKGWTLDLIREDLKTKFFPYAVCMEQWQGDFNFGTLVRNANAFGAKEVFYIGKKNYDRRSTVGTHHYTNVKFLPGLEELKALRQTYSYFIGIDNVPGSVEMNSFQWQSDSLLIFGEEGTGLTKEVIELCDHVVAITMYGSVRSLNAGVASGITMNDFVSKMK